MKTKSSSLLACLSLACLLAGNAAFARRESAGEPIRPSLAELPLQKGWTLVGRSAFRLLGDSREGIRLSGEGRMGFARLEGLDFADGVVDFDVRGEDVFQGSFVGLAFHGLDERTYDAVYFRPFNFRAADPARRSHAVQYISLPAHPWKRLRESHPGRYENTVSPTPDPGGWFHVRVVVVWPEVSVFVDGAEEPSLRVTQLSDRKCGWLGFWTDIAGGDFANLRISKASPSGAGRIPSDNH